MKDEDVLREWLKASGAVPGLFILLEKIVAKAKLGEAEILKAKREALKKFKTALQVEPDMFDFVDRELAALDKEAGK